MNKGILYLIPVPIHSEEDFNIKLIPPYIIEIINDLKFFAVENIRTSRRFIKKINPNFDIDNTNFFTVDKRGGKEIVRDLIDYLLEGNNVGIMSESGCPGIADPGQEICELAHKHQIAIKPDDNLLNYLQALTTLLTILVFSCSGDFQPFSRKGHELLQKIEDSKKPIVSRKNTYNNWTCHHNN